jgi:hypothetical protein
MGYHNNFTFNGQAIDKLHQYAGLVIHGIGIGGRVGRIAMANEVGEQYTAGCQIGKFQNREKVLLCTAQPVNKQE